MPTSNPPAAALLRWQIATGAALLVGYSGYYLCQSNLSVAAPLLAADAGLGLDRTTVGILASTGILAYAGGKSITGVAGDFLGGRTLFLGGLFLSVGATLCFGAATALPLLMLFWTINRFVQSAGWGGLTKTAVHWFPPERYGTVMSVLSLSFLFGDAAGRYVLGVLLSSGMSWRTLFITSAGILAVIGAFVALILRNSPAELGLPEPAVSPTNVFGARGTGSTPDNLFDLLEPYLASNAFWLTCTLSFGMTAIREALNTWIPAYLVDAHGLAPGDAARYSALFPLIGGVSALGIGVLADRAPNGNRVALMVPAMSGCALSLALLVAATSAHDLRLSLVAMAGTAACLLGPYTLLAGAIAMDMGGRREAPLRRASSTQPATSAGRQAGWPWGGWRTPPGGPPLSRDAGWPGLSRHGGGSPLWNRAQTTPELGRRTRNRMTGEQVLELLRARGASSYMGEPVTQLEHALQAAALADATGASEPLVVAALLHDIGHLLGPAAGQGGMPVADAHHEVAGSIYLAEYFRRSVTEPIRLHVAAKRYLCAVDPNYAASLSDASRRSLLLQGGAMAPLDIRVFEQSPWAQDAVRLRRWDDAARTPGHAVPRLATYEVPVSRQLEW